MTDASVLTIAGPGLVTVGYQAFPTVSVAPGPPVQEGDAAVFTVHLSGPTLVDVHIDYETCDETAVAGQDYEPSAGVVTIPAGETQASVTVTTRASLDERPERTFRLCLREAYAEAGGRTGTLIITGATATATIQRDVHIVPPVPPEGPNDFFSYWQDSAFYRNALRSDTDIQSAGTSHVHTEWQYDATMDAAKLWKTNYQDNPGVGGWNIKKQLLFPLPTSPANAIVIAWDWWWPIEFPRDCGGVRSFKTFQVMGGGHGWWTLMHHPFNARNFPPHVGAVITEAFRSGHAPPDGASPNGMTHTEGVWRSGPGTEPYDQRNFNASYPINHSVWVRHIVEIRPRQTPAAFTDWSAAYLSGATLNSNPRDPEGRWHMVSHWVMSETTDPQRVLYRVPMGWYRDGWQVPNAFRFEMNSSKVGALGPLHAWGRNVLVLDMLADEGDTQLFRRPVRA